MKAEDRNYIMYLEDIELSMNRISEYTSGMDFQHFKWDYKTVDAVIRNFEIIGEAAKKLPDYLKDKNPQIPWNEMYRLRNRIIHEYFGIDYEIIWEIAVNYLPNNLKELSAIIEYEKLKAKKYSCCNWCILLLRRQFIFKHIFVNYATFYI